MRIFFVAFFLGFVFVQCPLEAFSCINEWDYESAALIPVSYELQSFSQLPSLVPDFHPLLPLHFQTTQLQFVTECFFINVFKQTRSSEFSMNFDRRI